MDDSHADTLEKRCGEQDDVSDPKRKDESPPSDGAKQKAERLLGVVISGRYRVDEILALGGMGVVYRGTHVHMRKRVAIKLLLPETKGLPNLVARFEREAIAGAHIHHPNIASATDFGRLDDGSYFLIQEYVRGITLSHLIKQGAIPMERGVRMIRQLALALGAAHKMGVIHRDLKPRNVMVDEERGDLVKLIDFGLSKVPVDQIAEETDDDDEEGGSRELTTVGVVFGTVAYMAPEAGLGMWAVDERSDLYALGIMGYEMLAGKHPFDGTEPGELFYQQRSVMPQPIGVRVPGVVIKPEIEAIIFKLVQKDPTARYQKADEVVAAIDAVMPSAAEIVIPPERSSSATSQSSSSLRASKTRAPGIQDKSTATLPMLSGVPAPNLTVEIRESDLIPDGAPVTQRSASAPAEELKEQAAAAAPAAKASEEAPKDAAPAADAAKSARKAASTTLVSGEVPAQLLSGEAGSEERKSAPPKSGGRKPMPSKPAFGKSSSSGKFGPPKAPSSRPSSPPEAAARPADAKSNPSTSAPALVHSTPSPNATLVPVVPVRGRRSKGTLEWVVRVAAVLVILGAGGVFLWRSKFAKGPQPSTGPATQESVKAAPSEAPRGSASAAAKAPAGARAALSAAVGAKQWDEGAKAFSDLAAQDAAALKDAGVQAQVVELSLGLPPEKADPVLTALSKDFGADGLDVLYEVFLKGGTSDTGKKSFELLENKEVLEHASKELKTVVDLRKAACMKKVLLFDKAKKYGDQRTVDFLEVLRHPSCNRKKGDCCFPGNNMVDETVRTIKERSKKTAAP